MPQILAFSSSLVTLKFSIHNFFKTRVLLKILDAEFPYKLSFFEPLCLPANMAAETMKRPIITGTEGLHFQNKPKSYTLLQRLTPMSTSTSIFSGGNDTCS